MLTNSPFLPFPDALLWMYIRFLYQSQSRARCFCSGVYPLPHQSSAPDTLLLRKRIYPRKSIAKSCALFGCISVSLISRKVVRAVSVRAYIRFLISRVRPAQSFFRSGSVLENPSQSRARRLGGFCPSAQNRPFAATRGFPSLCRFGLFFQ